MYDVITIGSATRDVFLVSDEFEMIKSKRFFSGVGECISLGSKIEAHTIHITTGGGATNAAVTFSKLGFHTATVARIGTDQTGESVLRELQEDGVVTTLIKRVKGQTGYSVLLTTSQGERSVVVYRGVSTQSSGSDLPTRGSKTKWIYLTSLGGNVRAIKTFMALATKSNTSVAWNPGRGELEQGLSFVTPLLPKLAVLNMNLEEAQLLVGTKSLSKIFQTLGSHGTIILITDGSKGSHAYLNGKRFFAGTRHVPIVSRTGAGDAFGSGFVASWMRDKDIAQALAVGTLNAEGVIGSLGAKRGLLKTWPSKKQCEKISIKHL